MKTKSIIISAIIILSSLIISCRSSENIFEFLDYKNSNEELNSLFINKNKTNKLFFVGLKEGVNIKITQKNNVVFNNLSGKTITYKCSFSSRCELNNVKSIDIRIEGNSVGINSKYLKKYKFIKVICQTDQIKKILFSNNVSDFL